MSAIPDIPQELLAYATEFHLPTDASIKRSLASHYDLEGWVVHLDDHIRFLYADGSIGPAPRYRAFEELGLTHGEDDLQGKGDEEWRKLSEMTERFSRLFIMELATAWKLAQEHNLAQRRGIPGERFTELGTGRQGVVVADYGVERDGPYLRVKFDDAADDQPIQLRRIVFADDPARRCQPAERAR